MTIAQAARDAAEEIVNEHVFCLGETWYTEKDRLEKWGREVNEIAAIIERHVMPVTATEIQEWNKRNFGKTGIDDPMANVITWHKYDGSPETLPKEKRLVVLRHVRGGGDDIAFIQETWVKPSKTWCNVGAEWYDRKGKNLGRPQVGDLWFYRPESPTPSPHAEQGR